MTKAAVVLHDIKRLERFENRPAGPQINNLHRNEASKISSSYFFCLAVAFLKALRDILLKTSPYFPL